MTGCRGRGRPKTKSYTSSSSNNGNKFQYSMIEYLPTNIIRKPRTRSKTKSIVAIRTNHDRSSFQAKESLPDLVTRKRSRYRIEDNDNPRDCASQIISPVLNNISEQSVHLKRKKPMNYLVNSLANHGRELNIEKENKQRRESEITEFEYNFFKDVPEEDELPINFEIPGPIPDLVDLYSFHIVPQERRLTQRRVVQKKVGMK